MNFFSSKSTEKKLFYKNLRLPIHRNERAVCDHANDGVCLTPYLQERETHETCRHDHSDPVILRFLGTARPIRPR
jgi:hypothetical protein